MIQLPAIVTALLSGPVASMVAQLGLLLLRERVVRGVFAKTARYFERRNRAMAEAIVIDESAPADEKQNLIRERETLLYSADLAAEAAEAFEPPTVRILKDKAS